MTKKYKNYELHGEVFTSRKKAIIRRKQLAKEISDAKKKGVNINLRFRIIKKGNRYIVTKESKRN